MNGRMKKEGGGKREEEELEKALISIEKRLDKFEGKWGGLIKWAEQKYGKPEDSVQPTQEEKKETYNASKNLTNQKYVI